MAELAVSIKFEIKPFGRTVSRSRYFHPKILSHDGYSAIKKDEILSFITTRMDLEEIMVSEISQTEKDVFCIISVIQKSKIITEVIEGVVTKGWVLGEVGTY